MKTNASRAPLRHGALACLACLLLVTAPAAAQQPGAAPPAVGVLPVASRAVTESNEFIGRVEAIQRVELMARVTAYLQERLFQEGTEVKEGDLLFRLERAPFEAAVQVARGSVAEAQAELQNANLALGRAQALLSTPAGQRARVDDALAARNMAAARLVTAQAQQKQAQISLDYTEIRAPIAGRIGRAAVTEGNVVSPGSGALAAIVSQDPMYVSFTVPAGVLVDLRQRYADRGGLGALAVRLKLPRGEMYGPTGKLDFVDIDVGQDTDSIALRARIPNPVISGDPDHSRELTAGQFVSVLLEAAEPVQMLVVPRGAVLTDQRGDFVYVVGEGNKAERRPIRLGAQSNAEMAVLDEGVKEGERVVVEGIQRVRAGAVVSPAPAAVKVPGSDAPKSGG